MVKLQIKLEEEREERLRRAEKKREEEDQIFLLDVSKIEMMRVERIRTARRLSEAARGRAREAKEDEESWLKEVRRMEEETPLTPPTQPPIHMAKMPAGAEPWKSMSGTISVPDSQSGSRATEGRMLTNFNFDTAENSEEMQAKAQMTARPSQKQITIGDDARSSEEMPIHPSGVTRPAEGLSVPEVAAMPSKEQNTSGDDASSSEEKPGHSPGVTRPAEGLNVCTRVKTK